MKNYHDTKHELEILKLRLEVLKEKKESLQTLVDPKSVVTDKIIVDCGKKPPDQNIVNYVHLMGKVKKEIEARRIEAVRVKGKLNAMEKYLREIKDVKYRVFVMYYIDNLSMRTIRRRLYYGKSQVYRILERVKADLKTKEKW